MENNIDFEYYFNRYEKSADKKLSPQQKGILKKLSEQELEYCMETFEGKMRSNKKLNSWHFAYLMGILKQYRIHCPPEFYE